MYGPPGNAEWFDYVAEAGWVDCRKRFHDEEQQTFFRKGAAPYQLDHLSVDPDSAERLLEFTVLDNAIQTQLAGQISVAF